MKLVRDCDLLVLVAAAVATLVVGGSCDFSCVAAARCCSRGAVKSLLADSCIRHNHY